MVEPHKASQLDIACTVAAQGQVSVQGGTGQAQCIPAVDWPPGEHCRDIAGCREVAECRGTVILTGAAGELRPLSF